MPKPTGAIMGMGVGITALLIAGWYAAAPFSDPSERELANAISNDHGATDETNPATDRPLDRSVFDVVLWHEPPPPPPPESDRQTAVVNAAPPPPVDLLAITRTPDGYEAIFYDTQADRLHTVRSADDLGSYRVGAIGPTWVRLAHNGRETTLKLDQPRIAAREGEAPDE